MRINRVLGVSLTKFKKDINKMDIEDVHELLLDYMKIHKENHEKFLESANKLAESKARSALNIIRHLIPVYNKKSLVVFNKTKFEMKYDTEAYFKKHKRKQNGI